MAASTWRSKLKLKIQQQFLKCVMRFFIEIMYKVITVYMFITVLLLFLLLIVQAIYRAPYRNGSP
jgi:hypothetical protein